MKVVASNCCHCRFNRESVKTVEDRLKEIGKKFKHPSAVGKAQGTENFTSNVEMMQQENMKLVDGGEECNKYVSQTTLDILLFFIILWLRF